MPPRIARGGQPATTVLVHRIPFFDSLVCDEGHTHLPALSHLDDRPHPWSHRARRTSPRASRRDARVHRAYQGEPGGVRVFDLRVPRVLRTESGGARTGSWCDQATPQARAPAVSVSAQQGDLGGTPSSREISGLLPRRSLAARRSDRRRRSIRALRAPELPCSRPRAARRDARTPWGRTAPRGLPRFTPRCRWPTLRGRRASRRAAMSRAGT